MPEQSQSAVDVAARAQAELKHNLAEAQGHETPKAQPRTAQAGNSHSSGAGLKHRRRMGKAQPWHRSTGTAQERHRHKMSRAKPWHQQGMAQAEHGRSIGKGELAGITKPSN